MTPDYRNFLNFIMIKQTSKSDEKLKFFWGTTEHMITEIHDTNRYIEQELKEREPTPSDTNK